MYQTAFMFNLSCRRRERKTVVMPVFADPRFPNFSYRQLSGFAALQCEARLSGQRNHFHILASKENGAGVEIFTVRKSGCRGFSR